MKLADDVKQGTFLRRENRFTCLVKLGRRTETVYLPNSGRLETVLLPGTRVFVVERESPSRTTKYDLAVAALDGGFVSVDDRVPAELVNDALVKGTLSPFAQYSTIRREVARGRSRLDFLVSSRVSECFLEVKSVTLVQDGVARFPDAPTLRGRQHMQSLIWAKKEGYQAAVVFVIQRDDAESFSPNDEIDADFGQAVRQAQRAGVGLYAYRCGVTSREIELTGQVPVKL
jgi:sugar fermentation stimulation protein A